MNCISERFYKGLSDQKGNLNKKFASRRELCTLHFCRDLQTKHTTAMCMNHMGGLEAYKNSNLRILCMKITGSLSGPCKLQTTEKQVEGSKQVL